MNNWDRYLFQADQIEKMIEFCNDSKKNLLYLPKYKKALKIYDIEDISVRVFVDELQDLAKVHKKQMKRLELSSKDETALPLFI